MNIKKKLLQKRAISHNKNMWELYEKEIIDTPVFYYRNNEQLNEEFNIDGVYPEVIMEKSTTVDAILKYCDGVKTVAALNFASFKHPGGGFIKGAMTQEESLCHNSDLYEVLHFKAGSFYKSGIPNPLYTNRIILCQDIIFHYDDDYIRHVNCDVICCSAPNRKAARRIGISDEKIYKILLRRMRVLLNAVECDTIILGAWGCGVFGLESDRVARQFKYCLKDYKYSFKKVIFAIPDEKTYQIFDRIFSGGLVSKVTENN